MPTARGLNFRDEELLADVIARLIGDVRHVAVGNASPIPATAALLARERGHGKPYVSLLQSRKHNFFTDGARELFDCAGQGRIDVFFLSGGQIDGAGNVNLVSTGDYAHPQGALPRLVRLGLSLLRGAEGDPVPGRAFAPHAGAESRFHQRAGRQRARTSIARADRSRWSPTAACSRFADGRFTLASVHPGHTVAEVIENTGFDFERPATVPETPAPSPATLKLMRETVAPQLAEVYPQFAPQVFGVGAGRPYALKIRSDSIGLAGIAYCGRQPLWRRAGLA